jgi:hypothetical protein
MFLTRIDFITFLIEKAFKMKRTLLLFLFSLLYLSLSAIEKDSLSVGLSWNHRAYDRINGEIYVIGRGALFKSWDSKAGLVFRHYSLDFDGVSNLEASSVGVNFEETIYPFKKLLFLGLRLDLSADCLSSGSKDKISTEKGYTMPLLYYNFILNLVAGVNIKMTPKLNLRLRVLQGVEDRGLNNKSVSSVLNGTNIIRDNKNRYPTQFNIGIDFRL